MEPPRASALEALVTLAIAGVFAAVPVVARARWPWIVGSLAALGMVAVLLNHRPAMHLGLFAALCAALMSSPRLQNTWPMPLVLAIAAYLVWVALTPILRAPYGFRWFRLGRIDRQAVIWIAVIVAVSNFGLAAWYSLLQPDLTDAQALFRSYAASHWLVLFVGFPLLNAAAEEIAYRGIILHILERVWGRGWFALLAQAAIFGMFHLYGVPRGWIGVVLAGIYGLVLGMLKRRSGGLLAPIVAHAFADLAIVMLVLFMAD